ncbi:MAG: sporulation protein YunB [Clostridia bacterium]|nr:sporulation protein YunB [Clostridia bacterium]
MIECYNHKIWKSKNKKSKKGNKKVIILIIIVACISLFFIFYKFVITKQIFTICYDYSYAYATQSVNEGTLIALDNNLNYADLITIEKNNNGDISLMSANALKINSINKKVEKETAKILESKLRKGIPIPLLSFLGLNIFSGYGVEVNFNSLNVSSVTCTFSSNFESIGINQTLHSIYINIKCIVVVEIPLERKEIEYNNSILVSEVVLVGKVPEFYLKGNLFN